MKKTYYFSRQHLLKARVALLLLTLLTLPLLSWGQTFTETFGTAGPKIVGAANTAKDFDNDQFTFGGNASVLNNDAVDPAIPASTGYAGASGGSLIYFGPLNNGVKADPVPGVAYVFTARPINTSQLTSISLSLGVYVDPGGFSQPSDFVAEYRTTGFGAYTPIGNINITTPGWSKVTINNPFQGNTSATVELRFRRLASSGDYIAIDDVVLSGVVNSNFSVSPEALQFADTPISRTSASQNISVTGSGLTNPIAVQAPTGFRIRRQGDAAFLPEGSTLTLIPTNGNISTVVEVVFSPMTAGDFSGQVSFVSQGATSRFVSVSGKAVPPTITTTPTSLSFGNVEVNTRSSVQSTAVQGSNLADDISVQVPTGYEFRQAGDVNFLASGATLTLAQTNGNVNTTVEVRFAPTTTGAFNDDMSLVSTGASTQFVALTGTGVAPSPVITVSPSKITFPDTQVGRIANPISFSVSGQNLDNNTVVVRTPSTEFLVRLGQSGAFVSQITLTGTNGSLASTELQVQFSPSAVGNRAATIAASSGTTINQVLQVNGNGLAAATTPEIFITPDPATLDFGRVASNGSAQVLTFRVGGTLLGNNPLILTPASSASSNQNIQIREANVGEFDIRPLTFQSINGSVSERTIEVRLGGLLTTGSYAGTITASSPNSGAPNKVVNVVANSNGTSATISAENTLQPFSTVPGVASASQSYPLNGQGLIQDITVRAPALFQVALREADFASLNGATGNTITVVRNNAAGDGFTNPVPIFVRYLPTTANQQSDLANIFNTSEPAVGSSVSVQGFSAPSVAIQAAIPQIADVVVNTVSEPVAFTVRAARVRQPITVAEVLTNPSQFNNPVTDQFQISLTQNDADFGSTVTFTPNSSTFSIDQVVYVRYKPTHIGDATSKLQFQSNDFTTTSFQDFSANGNLSGKALSTQPTTQTTISLTRNGSTATVTFTPAQGGNTSGAGEGRLIVASLNNGLDGSSQPLDAQSYLAADGTYGQGATLAPGYFSVYTGTGDQAVVKGLDPTKAYYFYVFDYNYVATNSIGQRLTVPGAENYLTPTPASQLVPVAAIAPNAPLPVELTAFTAKLTRNQVNLSWETASEKDNKGFEVQRSQDGVTFSTILFKKGQGSTSSKTKYAAVDERPLVGISYYRLKQIDNDGKFTYSPVVTIKNLGVADVTFYPNPTSGKLTISLPQEQEAIDVKVRITDLSGREVKALTLPSTGEADLSELKAGTYLITVGVGNHKVTRRVVKN